MGSTSRSGRPRRRASLSSHYADLLARQARSGLSLPEFAESVGVSAGTLYRWRGRLSGFARRTGTNPRVVEVAVVPASKPGPAPIVSTPSIGVDLRSGHRLDVRMGFDESELKRLVGVLESC